MERCGKARLDCRDATILVAAAALARGQHDNAIVRGEIQMNLGLLAAGVGDVGGLLEGSEAGHAAKRPDQLMVCRDVDGSWGGGDSCDDCGADCTEHGTWTGGGAGASDEYGGESSANGSNGRPVDGAVFLGVDRFRDEWQLHPCYGIHGADNDGRWKDREATGMGIRVSNLPEPRRTLSRCPCGVAGT